MSDKRTKYSEETKRKAAEDFKEIVRISATSTLQIQMPTTTNIEDLRSKKEELLKFHRCV